VALATGFHPFAFAPGAASSDGPVRRKGVAKRFDDNENSNMVKLVPERADILA
jgi:hypothetical protein